MNYTTERGPKLTEWVINKIKRDYPGDVALLVGVAHKSTDGSGHGECFDCYVSATERGRELGREIKIGGVNHDLFDCGWERLERMANLRDGAAFLVIDGEILYSRCPEDAARFEALRQKQKDNLVDPRFVYRRALELLDDAMNLYRNMMFEERPHQVRLAAGYIYHYLLTAVLFLNGTYWTAHWRGNLAQLARCKEKPEQFKAYCRALLAAKSTNELRSIAHLVIQAARTFIAAHKPESEKDEFRSTTTTASTTHFKNVDPPLKLLEYKMDENGIFYIPRPTWTPKFVGQNAMVYVVYGSVRVKFQYGQKDWLIHMWKGRYGLVMLGSEICVATKPSTQKAEEYIIATPEEALAFKMDVYQKNFSADKTKYLFTRGPESAGWLNGFVPGSFYEDNKKSEIIMVGSIEFPEEEMLRAFEASFAKAGFRKGTPSQRNPETYAIHENTLTFSWQYIDQDA